MAVEFRVLGDVEAEVDGRVVDVGHARQRCVLAALLIDVNRVVPIDQLLDRVWADGLPQRARTTLSTYLSRLRQALAAAPEVELARRLRGYVLTVDPMAVDLCRFHHLVARARATADDRTAAALFEQALGLWRGLPLASLDTPWADDVREGLGTERLAAELDRNDRLLASGQHTAVLGELASRAVAHPMDERLAGQLMLALYRCGRQADALQHYHQLRRRLGEELGVDPGPPLQGLYRQILAADPALAVAEVAQPALPAGPPAPRQLPSPPTSFTGRTREIAALDAAMATAEGTTTVGMSAVSGTAGVGKTALAVHWAHRVADRFPDGQLYVNLRGFDPGGSPTDPGEAVRGFLDALGVPSQRIPAGLDAQAALYRSVLAGRQVLVVLDNVRDVEQVRPLLPGSAGCRVVVTSRTELTPLVANEGAYPLALDLLSPQDARELLTVRLGARRLAAEPDAVDEIIVRCAGLPLALAIVAARAAVRPRLALAGLAAELRETAGLDALQGGDAGTDARVVFSWSYRTLSEPAARLFRLLGLHPGPDIAVPAAASLAAAPVGQVRSVLAELTRANLLTEHAAGRYAFHDLLRAYAAEQARAHDARPEQVAARHRTVDHYLHTAHAAACLLDPARKGIAVDLPEPGTEPEQVVDHDCALAWFTAEHAVLLRLVEWTTASGSHHHTWRLAWTLTRFLEWRGHWRDLAIIQQAALTAAQHLGDVPGQATAGRFLAHACALLGRYDHAQAHIERVLDVLGPHGDPVARGHAHNAYASVLEAQGRYREALHHAQQALDLVETANQPGFQARVLNWVGWLHAQLGRYELAVGFCERALAMLNKLGDRAGQASTLDSIGYAHHHLGRYDQAITCYQRALDLSRDVGNRCAEAEALTHLGDTHHAIGDRDAAHLAWLEALAICDDLALPDADKVRARLDRLATVTQP